MCSYFCIYFSSCGHFGQEIYTVCPEATKRGYSCATLVRMASPLQSQPLCPQCRPVDDALTLRLMIMLALPFLISMEMCTYIWETLAWALAGCWGCMPALQINIQYLGQPLKIRTIGEHVLHSLTWLMWSTYNVITNGNIKAYTAPTLVIAYTIFQEAAVTKWLEFVIKYLTPFQFSRICTSFITEVWPAMTAMYRVLSMVTLMLLGMYIYESSESLSDAWHFVSLVTWAAYGLPPMWWLLRMLLDPIEQILPRQRVIPIAIGKGMSASWRAAALPFQLPMAFHNWFDERFLRRDLPSYLPDPRDGWPVFTGQGRSSQMGVASQLELEYSDGKIYELELDQGIYQKAFRGDVPAQARRGSYERIKPVVNEHTRAPPSPLRCTNVTRVVEDEASSSSPSSSPELAKHD